MSASTATELLTVINTCDTWKWARNDQNHGELSTLVDDFNALQTPFVRVWLTGDLDLVRMSFAASTIQEQLESQVPGIHEAAKKINAKVQQLSSMRRATLS